MPSTQSPAAILHTQQILAEIKVDQSAVTAQHDDLVCYTQRIPSPVLARLRRAARKHEVTQSDIVVRAVKSIVPPLLSWSNSPQSPAAVQHAKEIMEEIKDGAGLASVRRGTLVCYTQRMPKSLRNGLRMVSKENGVSQSDIVLQALNTMLPVLLSDEELLFEPISLVPPLGS